MRIALLANASNNHTVRWAKFFASQGHQTLLLSDTPASLAIAGVKVVSPKMDLATRFVAFKLTGSEYANNRFKYRAYTKPMEEFRPEVVVAMEALSYGPVLPHWEGSPRVLVPWGSDVLVWARKGGEARGLVEGAIAAADCLTANAPGMEADLFAGLDARPAAIDLFAWGCDTNIFSRGDGSARTDARRALGLPLEPRIVLSPRNATNHLGAGMIVESWLVAKQTGHLGGDLLVVLRGSAGQDEWDALQRHAARLGDSASIRFVGDYADASRMAYFMRASDAFVSFPETDFFAVTIMEGMARSEERRSWRRCRRTGVRWRRSRSSATRSGRSWRTRARCPAWSGRSSAGRGSGRGGTEQSGSSTRRGRCGWGTSGGTRGGWRTCSRRRGAPLRRGGGSPRPGGPTCGSRGRAGPAGSWPCGRRSRFRP